MTSNLISKMSWCTIVLKPHDLTHMQCHIFQELMQYVLREIQVRVTGDIRWKKIWPNNTSIQTPCPHVETVVLLKVMGVCSTRVFISPNKALAEIYNTFPGEFGFISEEDPPWKVGLINTTAQEPSEEVDSWHKISGRNACTLWGWYGCSC